ncbi:M28 family peptidase [Roseibium sp. MMSF_3544]|uniref:M28 family peptidase n=1 Tax=unclassified Roseibium TaxID=2629323 RepID=UPI00273EC6C1|nr:M28 family peptidase [Roseibium sp. MMSF_3544]
MSDRTLSDPDALFSDLNTLCEFGGRFAGTASEVAARNWLARAASAALGVPCKEHHFHHVGWQALNARLSVNGDADALCHPLVRAEPTPPEGIEAEVVDLGRGLPEDFKASGADLNGKIAMVGHEVMFSSDTFHRRKKLQLARDAGAVAILVVSRVANQPVTGSARAEEPGLPALGITPETAVAIRLARPSERRARILIETRSQMAKGVNLLFDRPGASGKWIVLSAHYDGHDIGESALDNATGVVLCLEIARRLRNLYDFSNHGVRLAFFTFEEWGLIGSQRYVSELSVKEADQILLNINADTVVGGQGLTALTSGFKGLSSWLERELAESSLSLKIHEPFQPNSDHASFARHGIPALRLLSGFNEPESAAKFVLTGGDTRELVDPSSLERAVDVTEHLTLSALRAGPDITGRWPHKNYEPVASHRT